MFSSNKWSVSSIHSPFSDVFMNGKKKRKVDVLCARLCFLKSCFVVIWIKMHFFQPASVMSVLDLYKFITIYVKRHMATMKCFFILPVKIVLYFLIFGNICVR